MVTFLFVPGDQPDKLRKAAASSADAVIADLEDGVAPDRKDAARSAIASARELFAGSAACRLILRCNAPGSAEFAGDLELAANLPLFALMIPKCESGEDVRAVEGITCARIPLVESPRGVHRIEEILTASPLVGRVAFGAVDFALALGVEWTPEGVERRHAMERLVLVSNAVGRKPPVDAVFPVLDDDDALRRDAVAGMRMGFGGKMVVHPRHLPLVAEVYRPSEERIAWARRVIQAWEQSGKSAVFACDGRMVDAPVLESARRVLDLE